MYTLKKRVNKKLQPETKKKNEIEKHEKINKFNFKIAKKKHEFFSQNPKKKKGR